MKTEEAKWNDGKPTYPAPPRPGEMKASYYKSLNAETMKVLTEEDKKEVVEGFVEMKEEFTVALSKLDEKLGRNHTVCQKMRTIVETLSSFTDSELFEVHNIMSELEQNSNHDS